MRLVELVVGLVCGGLRRRLPFERAVAALEDLAEDANLRPGVSDASEKPVAAKECMICMSAPREVRYACGHLTCCKECTDALLATEGQRCPQNMCPTCRARIVVIGTGSNLAFEATFVQQACPPPPPVEMPKAAAQREYAPGHEIVADFGSGSIGAFLASRYDANGHDVGVFINRVDTGSQADAFGVSAGMKIVAVNGQSTVGMSRQDIASLAAERPFKATFRMVAGRDRGTSSRPPSAAPPSSSSRPGPLLAPPPGFPPGHNPFPPAPAPAPAPAGRRGRAASPARPAERRRSKSPFRRLLGR